MNYKIIGKYIKELKFNIPNPKTFFLLSKDIANYKINIDIKSAQVKQNIIEVLKTAKKLNMKTFSLVGENDENVLEYSDNTIKIPSSKTGVVQQAHITIGQIICMNIEASII